MTARRLARVIRLTAVAVLALGGFGCGGHRAESPFLGTSPTPAALLAALDASAPPGDAFEANLYIEFEGGFLEDRSAKINGQIAWAPDRVRLVGAYGAFKKLFDLLVVGEEFRLYDNEAHTVYLGDSADPAAAAELGLAVRPGDLPRLLRLGGRGPLDEAIVLSVRAPTRDRIEASFEAAGDPGRWIARYDAGGWRLTSLERWVDDALVLRVEYERYTEIDGRPVPKRIEVTRPLGSERVRIEVRSLAFRDSARARSFRFSTPDDATVERVGRARKALPSTPLGR
jgi:hypothetical protein